MLFHIFAVCQSLVNLKFVLGLNFKVYNNYHGIRLIEFAANSLNLRCFFHNFTPSLFVNSICTIKTAITKQSQPSRQCIPANSLVFNLEAPYTIEVMERKTNRHCPVASTTVLHCSALQCLPFSCFWHVTKLSNFNQSQKRTDNSALVAWS